MPFAVVSAVDRGMGVLFIYLFIYLLMKSFICRGCVNPVTGIGCTSIDIGADANLELVDKFCYLGDM